MKKFVTQLWEAASKPKQDISSNNLFSLIGFDADKARLGWVVPPDWSLIQQSLIKCLNVIKDKKKFIFIGMGGSINGIKTVAGLGKRRFIYALDSLDPAALKDILAQIKSLKDTMIIPISKSGTTKETQSLANTLREIFKKRYVKRHFLWLVDKDSYAKLDSLGWRGFSRLPIQVNEKTDIGGRFSSPHTLVFFLPLLLVLNKNLSNLKKIYNQYLSLKDSIIRQADQDAIRLSKKREAYFSVKVPADILVCFRTWVTQLFQESLGSKKNNFFVKTLVCDKKTNAPGFSNIFLKVKIKNPTVRLMSIMYYLQNFVALYAYAKRINFINQPCVEQYKNKMTRLNTSDSGHIKEIDLHSLVKMVKKKLKPHHKFIEIVVYFYPSSESLRRIVSEFRNNFPGFCIFIFIGSDWNHHSYQAAYGDKNSFYVLLAKDNYVTSVPPADPRQLKENVQNLKLISYATHLTIKRKSLLFMLKTV
jgi:glucose-6-phosphate isomerase